jgi:MoxR-like ATPase
MEANTETTTTTQRRKGNGKAKNAVLTVREKFEKLRSFLNERFKEREDLVTGLILSALVGQHLYVVGPPGTGKSALIRSFSLALDATFFDWLMTRFTTPEEVLGAISLTGLQQDRMTRNMKGKLAEADFVFLDEVFKSNSACLNAILPAMNERIVHDDGQAKPIQLQTLMGASNELPEDKELEALNDRFLLRYIVDYIVDERKWRGLMRGGVERRRKARANKNKAVKPPITMTLSDLEEAADEVVNVDVNDDTIVAYRDLRANLKSEGITVSDRRWEDLVSVLQAYAWLCGDDEVDPIHFGILANGLWRYPEQYQKVVKLVSQVASPALAEAREYHDNVMELVNALPQSGELDKQGRSTINELKKAIKHVKSLAKGTKSKAVRAEIEKLGSALTENHVKIRERIMAEMDL